MTCCKGNYALHVKTNMSPRNSGWDAEERRKWRYRAVTMRVLLNKGLDTLEVFRHNYIYTPLDNFSRCTCPTKIPNWQPCGSKER